MTLFAFVHGAGDGGWAWHLVEQELQTGGHSTVAPDLPDSGSATLTDYADVVRDAIGTPREAVVVVGHSYGAFTAPLVAGRLPASGLVLVAGMVPRPGEAPADWWAATGHAAAVHEQAALDGGLTGSSDPYVCYYHDVPRELADRALREERDHPSTVADSQPWPLDAFPEVPTRFVLCTQDRAFPPAFMRRLARDRLGLIADEIESGHCVSLSRPRELAALLEAHTADLGSEQRWTSH